MSWSDNRSRESGVPLKVRQENLRQINLVLDKLASDEDLHDDLKQPEVKRALRHWTGEQRLPSEEAAKLQDHRRIVYVLQRMQMFHTVFKQAGIGKVPLELFLLRAKTVPESLATELFGEDIYGTVEASSNETKNVKETKRIVINGNNTKANVPQAAPVLQSSHSNTAEGASADDIKKAMDSTERARIAAEEDYAANREKIEQMMKDSPPPESEAHLLTVLTGVVAIVAIVVYYFYFTTKEYDETSEM